MNREGSRNLIEPVIPLMIIALPAITTIILHHPCHLSEGMTTIIFAALYIPALPVAYHYLKKFEKHDAEALRAKVISGKRLPSSPPKPPRHARISDNINGWVLRDEIAANIEIGRSLEDDLKKMEPVGDSLIAWAVSSAEPLSAITHVENQHEPRSLKEEFLKLTRDITYISLDTPQATSCQIARSYFEIAIEYLSEVCNNMSDYLEAAGHPSRDPRYSMKISGGTFYGAQFASQIANIDSTISHVTQQGEDRVGEALKALEQAILADTKDNDPLRQDLIDNLEDIVEAANTPAESRKKGRIKAAFNALVQAATTSAELGKAINTWSNVLSSLTS